jgi:hypothetical protein
MPKNLPPDPASKLASYGDKPGIAAVDEELDYWTRERGYSEEEYRELVRKLGGLRHLKPRA